MGRTSTPDSVLGKRKAEVSSRLVLDASALVRV